MSCLGNSAFQSCPSLSQIVLTSGLTIIGFQMFSLNNALLSVTVPSTLTSIGNNSDNKVNVIIRIILSQNITFYILLRHAIQNYILFVLILTGDIAFASCPSLSSLVLNDGLTILGNNMFLTNNISSPVIIPSTVTTISKWQYIDIK